MRIKIQSKKFNNTYIYGTFLEQRSAPQLAIIMSGLSGNDARSLTSSASKFFLKNGFSTLRFNFCNDDKPRNHKVDALGIENMSLLVYARELKNIVDTFGKKYASIVLVSHSFSAPIMVTFLDRYQTYLSKTKIVLWDPNLVPWGKNLMGEEFLFDRNKKMYVQKQTKNPLILNKAFYRELVGTKNSAEILGSFRKSVCIIGAQKGAQEDTKAYISKIRNKNSSTLAILKGADHLFSSKNIQKKLFATTLNFVK